MAHCRLTMTNRDNELDLILWGWRPYAYRYARSIGCPQDMLDDVVSEAFLWALPYARKSNADKSPHNAWCKNLMRWGVLRVYNKVKNTVHVPRTVEDSNVTVSIEDVQEIPSVDTPIDMVIDFKMRMERLTPRQREILQAYMDNGGDMSEAGRQLGITYQRIQSVLRVVRKMDDK